MKLDAALSSVPPADDKQCPDRVEVERDEREVSAVTVKTWVAHLRSHGWTDADLLAWPTRARQGVTRWEAGERSR